MVKQSKNKVKLNKRYKAIGRIPIAALRKIQEVMELPDNVRTIRANITNTVKHNLEHMEEMEKQLSKLGLTKEDYAEFVARNYNEIHLGNRPLSLLLVVTHIEDFDHVAAVHIYYNKSENFWLVTTVHAMRHKDLKNIPLIWKK